MGGLSVQFPAFTLALAVGHGCAVPNSRGRGNRHRDEHAVRHGAAVPYGKIVCAGSHTLNRDTSVAKSMPLRSRVPRAVLNCSAMALFFCAIDSVTCDALAISSACFS
jgi:hypothetical protein